MITLTFRQLACFAIGSYMIYSAGYERGRKVGQLEARVAQPMSEKLSTE